MDWWDEGDARMRGVSDTHLAENPDGRLVFLTQSRCVVWQSNSASVRNWVLAQGVPPNQAEAVIQLARIRYDIQD